MNQTRSPIPSENTASNIEELSEGLTREWLNDRQIVVYTVKDVRRETVDAWAEAFKSDISNWSTDQLFRVVHDLRIAGGVTPYGRARGQEMFNTCPEVSVKVALILPATFVNDLIRLFVRTQTRPTTVRTREFFKTREEALNWVTK